MAESLVAFCARKVQRVAINVSTVDYRFLKMYHVVSGRIVDYVVLRTNNTRDFFGSEDVNSKI